jgi:hypothetical protein
MKKIYLFLGLLVGFSTASIAQGDDCNSAVSVGAGLHSANGPASGGGAINDDGGANADWYSFTATCDGTIDVSSCISGTDTDLFVYEGTCPTVEADNIAFDDDGCTPCCSSLETGIPVTQGTTYYIEWGDQWSTAAFDWELTFNGPAYTGVFSNTTFEGTDLAWNAAGGETEWQVEWGIAGFVPGSGTIWNVTAGADTTWTGLNPETTYDVWITGTGQCPEAYSFTTAAVCPVPTIAATTPGNVDAILDWFENGTAVEWDVEYGMDGFLLGSGTQAYGVVLGTDTTVTGLFGSTDYDWYVRAVCDVTLPLDTFSFWVGPETFTTNQVCADPNTLDTINSDPFGTDLTWLPGGLESEWNVQWGEAGFPLSGVGANVINGNITGSETLTGLTPGMTYDFYVQSVCGASPDSISLWVGPFTWTSPTFCTDPSNGGFANLTTTSVDFGWLVNGSETNWTVEYGESGFTPGSGTMVPATNDTISVTGLNPETTYCFYVQANCGSTPDSSSNWVGTYCVTTLTSCPLPTTLGTMNITNSAANLIWQAGGSEVSWNIEWGVPGFSAGMGEEAGSIDATSDNPYYVTGLNESAPYWFYVQAECGGGDTSQWAGPFQFFTQLVNDDACDAIKLNVDTPMVQHYNTGATSQVGEPVPGATGNCNDQDGWCVSGSGTTVWFKFSAPLSGAVEITTYEPTTAITDGYTNIALYSVGDCSVFGSYVEEAANTLDIDAFQPPYGSTMTLCALNPGQEYYIMVDDLGFTLPNYFGIQVTSIDPAISAGTAAPISACAGDITPVDLFTAVTGNSTVDGQWYNPTVAIGNEFPNLLDFSTAPAGTYGFFYVDGSVCGADTVETSVTVEEGPNAGADGTVTSCNTTDVILVQELSGVVELGGTWSDDDATGALTNGVFNAFGVAAGTYTFTYTVASSTACPDATATVTVTLTDCLGLDTEVDNATLEVYPNPVEDILTVTNVNINTNFTIDIMDIQGKVVYTESYSGYNGNLEMNMNVVEDGVYIVRLTSEDSIQEVRVVKQ